MRKSPHPVSQVCPKCGSTAHKKVDPNWQPAIVNDRICDECGTRYSPPPPAYLGYFVIPVSIGVILGGCGLFYWHTFAKDPTIQLGRIPDLLIVAFYILMIVGGLSGIVGWIKRPNR